MGRRGGVRTFFEGRGGALLADMQRAFPSICPKFQEWMANKLEAPEWFKAALYKGFRRVTHVLYAHKRIGRRNGIRNDTK